MVGAGPGVADVLTQRSNRKKEQQAFAVRLARWGLTITSGLLTALVACFIDVNVKYLNKFKYDTTYAKIVEGRQNKHDLTAHLWVPLAVFVSINVAYALIPALLVSFVEPVARGSGIPEIKCYLNGVKIPRVVSAHQWPAGRAVPGQARSPPSLILRGSVVRPLRRSA
eukprot:COSAG01_NODE_15554_length_1324_cov_1.269388_2_plen_168_part_00